MKDGVILNPTFTDYLLPTILDASRCGGASHRARGIMGPVRGERVGESPTYLPRRRRSAAIRAASGKDSTGFRSALRT